MNVLARFSVAVLTLVTLVAVLSVAACADRARTSDEKAAATASNAAALQGSDDERDAMPSGGTEGTQSIASTRSENEAPEAVAAGQQSDDYTGEMSDSNSYPRAIISTEFGDLTVELWNDVAPLHVENFLKLARSGFYDNLTFHRVIPGFVIQGGCPHGTGTGGPGWTVDAEFNDRQHVPGTLSMARSADPNSAGSQFFICLTREKCRHLDGQYTAFGQVIEGLDIVEKLGAVKTGRGDRPIEPLALNGVRPIE